MDKPACERVAPPLDRRQSTRFYSTLSCSQDAFIKWREGSLARELWSGWEQVMMNLFIAPGGRTFWDQRGYLFGDEFRRYVEGDLMKRDPHPEARPMGLFPLKTPVSPDEAAE